MDAAGRVIDGDQILAVLAIALKAEGRLAGDTVVATVMSNLGFRHAMRAAGIDVVETPVGDRYLIAAMLDGKYVLGGEQSGHIIMLDHATTGDGMLTGLHLLAEAARQDRPLADLASVMTRYPQVLISVPGVDKARVASSSVLAEAVARGRGGARRCWPGTRPAERHRACGAGDGRGRRRRSGRAPGRLACRHDQGSRLVRARLVCVGVSLRASDCVAPACACAPWQA